HDKEIPMLVSEKIQKYAERLPERMQIEALDFIEYLLSRWKQETEEDAEWNELSLSMMMRGMEDEPGPEYTLDDLKVVFR
ncbi:MAG: hypothetical protein AB1750_04145, partial [Chloroflexota bacterium]